MPQEKQPENESLGYSDTPVLSSGYRVHDGTRPQPRKVENPGVPSDATVLFDGTSLEGWKRVGDGDAPAAWKLLGNGGMEVVPGSGNIETVAEFGDCQLHVEFMSPAEILGEGQGRGNSGVFLMGRYEVQVLDNWENPTYPDGTVGGLYGQTPPLVNAIHAPGEWNTYDILWECPRFAGENVVAPARITVLLNGVVIHHAKELAGLTMHQELPYYVPHGSTGPLQLQDHGDRVRFRNIWVRELGGYDQP